MSVAPHVDLLGLIGCPVGTGCGGLTRNPSAKTPFDFSESCDGAVAAYKSEKRVERRTSQSFSRLETTCLTKSVTSQIEIEARRKSV